MPWALGLSADFLRSASQLHNQAGGAPLAYEEPGIVPRENFPEPSRRERGRTAAGVGGQRFTVEGAPGFHGQRHADPAAAMPSSTIPYSQHTGGPQYALPTAAEQKTYDWQAPSLEAGAAAPASGTSHMASSFFTARPDASLRVQHYTAIDPGYGGERLHHAPTVAAEPSYMYCQWSQHLHVHDAAVPVNTSRTHTVQRRQQQQQQQEPQQQWTAHLQQQGPLLHAASDYYPSASATMKRQRPPRTSGSAWSTGYFSSTQAADEWCPPPATLQAAPMYATSQGSVHCARAHLAADLADLGVRRQQRQPRAKDSVSPAAAPAAAPNGPSACRETESTTARPEPRIGETLSECLDFAKARKLSWHEAELILLAVRGWLTHCLSRSCNFHTSVLLTQMVPAGGERAVDAARATYIRDKALRSVLRETKGQ